MYYAKNHTKLTAMMLFCIGSQGCVGALNQELSCNSGTNDMLPSKVNHSSVMPVLPEGRYVSSFAEASTPPLASSDLVQRLSERSFLLKQQGYLGAQVNFH
ncbi:MAG: hypothetical protein AAFP93_01580, partial [Bacteroidota bacterium]